MINPKEYADYEVHSKQSGFLCPLKDFAEKLWSDFEKSRVQQPATEPDENAKLQAFAQSRHGDRNSFYEGWEICPNCGLNLRTCGPATNLFPHFMGGCKKAPITAAEAKEE